MGEHLAMVSLSSYLSAFMEENLVLLSRFCQSHVSWLRASLQPPWVGSTARPWSPVDAHPLRLGDLRASNVLACSGAHLTWVLSGPGERDKTLAAERVRGEETPVQAGACPTVRDAEGRQSAPQICPWSLTLVPQLLS